MPDDGRAPPPPARLAHQQTAPQTCAYCDRPFLPDEYSIVLMREGTPVAAYHERCHPHHRRRGCSGC